MSEEAETIELRLPTEAKLHVYPSTERPGVWIVKAEVSAVDVTNGEPAHFATTLWWHNGRPPRGEIAQTMINMLAHEVCEQLGLDPHARLSLPKTPLVKMTDAEYAAVFKRPTESACADGEFDR